MVNLNSRAKKFIEYIINNYQNDEFILEREVPVLNGEKVIYGATKIVAPEIIDNKVIKVALRSEIETVYNKDIDELVEEEIEMENFSKREFEIYMLAKKKGMEKFFVKIEKYNDIIYIQDKLENTNLWTIIDKEKSIMWQDSKELTTLFDDCYYLSLAVNEDYDVLYALTQTYTKEELLSLDTFIQESEFPINDLCSRNCGINEEGKVVFFDYGGYYY